MKKVNLDIDDVTIKDIEEHKLLDVSELKKDIKKLRNVDVIDNVNNFYGNPFLYHYQLKNLLKCKRENGKTIYDVYNDKEEWKKLKESTKKRDRGGKTAAGNIWECFRINLGSVVMFKSTTAKYLYKKYKAKNVLDPTAGWGGRMLGAWALDINYTGIDTNIEMKQSYDKMIDFLNNENKNNLFGRKSQLKMIWGSCLDVDFSKMDYDFVLTSPPYVNLEIYEHMDLWDSNEQFYKEFFIPLWEKCVKNIKKEGNVCFNISPKMYKDYLEFGGVPCDLEENLLQQTGSNKKEDKIYIWKC